MRSVGIKMADFGNFANFSSHYRFQQSLQYNQNYFQPHPPLNRNFGFHPNSLPPHPEHRPSAHPRHRNSSNRRQNRHNRSREAQHKGGAFACNVCNLWFRTSFQLANHIDESHVNCDFENCKYSAPLSLLEFHKLRHLKNERGEYLESRDETLQWIANRRLKHPSNPCPSTEAKVEPTALEKLLKKNLNGVVDYPKKSEVASALCPVLNKIAPLPSALIRMQDPTKYDYMLRRNERGCGPYSYRSVFSGDLENHRKGVSSCIVSKRPPIRLLLLKKDIERNERLLLDVIKNIVANNFFR